MIKPPTSYNNCRTQQSFHFECRLPYRLTSLQRVINLTACVSDICLYFTTLLLVNQNEIAIFL